MLLLSLNSRKSDLWQICFKQVNQDYLSPFTIIVANRNTCVERSQFCLKADSRFTCSRRSNTYMAHDQQCYLYRKIFIVMSLILRLRLDNLLSFTLNEPIILGSFALLTRIHSLRIRTVCKILQLYVAATVRMHSDAVLSSTGTPLMKIVTKNNRQ